MWTISPTAAASSVIPYLGRGGVPFGKRERPHVAQDATGALTHFISGVCLTPACTPWAPSFKPTEDCSPAAQYAKCGGCGDDRTWTHVQPLATV